MRIIHDYPLKLQNSVFSLPLAERAKFLSVSQYDNNTWLWVEVETSNPTYFYKFRTFKTGEKIPEDFKGTYLGSVEEQKFLWWHIYLIEE